VKEWSQGGFGDLTLDYVLKKGVLKNVFDGFPSCVRRTVVQTTGLRKGRQHHRRSKSLQGGEAVGGYLGRTMSK